MSVKPLHMVHNREAPAAPAPLPRSPLYCGRAYMIHSGADCTATVPSALIGDYRISPQQAVVEAPLFVEGRARVYLYDNGSQFGQAEATLRVDDTPLSGMEVRGNRFCLTHSELIGPELEEGADGTRLGMQAGFAMQFDSVDYAAQLGVIHLVSSRRFILLGDGTELSLLEAEEPVLYLPQGDGDGLDLIAPMQGLGEKQEYTLSLQLEQPIPEGVDGVAVESVTVLEQYQSYFMQREIDAGVDTIWTPVLAPVSWGWSIRVGRRVDGEWGIVRRKLIRPTVGHDGLELPLWQDNSRRLTRRI